MLPQDGARILAAVCDGDLEPIKRLVINREADEYSRGAAVAALALLSVWGEVPRDTIIEYFAWLAGEGLEREPSYVWSALAIESADIEALAIFPALRRAYDEGLIDPRTMRRSELDDVHLQRPGLAPHLPESRTTWKEVRHARFGHVSEHAERGCVLGWCCNQLATSRLRWR